MFVALAPLLLAAPTLAAPAGPSAPARLDTAPELLSPAPHAAQAAQYGRGERPAWWADFLARPAPPPVAPPPPATGRATVYGYWPYWGPDPTTLDFPRLTHLAIFSVGLNSDGSLYSTDTWNEVAPQVVPLAHAAGVRVHLCITSFSSSTHSAVLPSSSRRATTISQLAELVDRYGADGVNVDFEGLSSSNRDYFTTFIRELSAAVEDVYIATPAIDWSGAFDYDQLALNSEGLFIMGYGYHWTGGDPGPNDPLYGGGAWGSYSLEWSVDDYLEYDAPADKIILGLPLYGQEWPVSSSRVPGTATGDGWSVTMEEAVPIANAEGRQYDTTTRSPYVLRASTQLWYDDPSSVQERIQYSVGRGIQGIGFWALGYESSPTSFWDMVEAETTWDVPDDTGGDNGGGDNGGTDTSGDNGGADSGDTAADNGGTDNGGEDLDSDGRADVIRGEKGGCATAPGAGLLGLAAGLTLTLRRRRR